MASEAQIRANQANAQKSSRPRAVEGNEQSRRNALKHGLTGTGVVLSESDAIEVGRRTHEYVAELKPTNAVEYALVERIVIATIRMDRCVAHEVVSTADNLRQAEADFVAPEGVEEPQVAKLRAEACARALFDSSKEATLARKYEAAAERSFFRALKELRLLQNAEKPVNPAVQAEVFRQELGSILAASKEDAEFYARYGEYLKDDPSMPELRPRKGTFVPNSPRLSASGCSFDVPIAIGRPR